MSKDVTDEMLLESWHEQLTKWQHNLAQRPKQVTALCRKGIPEPLRGEVWQLLTGVGDSKEMLETYRVLLSKVGLGRQEDYTNLWGGEGDIIEIIIQYMIHLLILFP